jgi:hypothetical protein
MHYLCEICALGTSITFSRSKERIAAAYTCLGILMVVPEHLNEKKHNKAPRSPAGYVIATRYLIAYLRMLKGDGQS